MITDITQTGMTELNSKVRDYSVGLKTTDGVHGQTKETYWDNPNFTKFYGYYNEIPELKTAIKAYATWVLGKGWNISNSIAKVRVEGIDGWGEDTFNSILWNMLIIKKVNGDAFAEIIEDDKGKFINLKPLAPNRVRIVVNEKGRIIAYDYMDAEGKEAVKRFKIEENKIFHISNDRVADNIHGDSIIDSCQWVIDARKEAMNDWRRISHRSTIRILYVEEDSPSRVSNLKRDYAEAINKGELLILPVKKGDAEFSELTLPPVDAFLSWIKYLENFFYQALGVPKVILGGSEEFTEASSKISYLTYEQIYTREVVDLEADLWNQLGLKITFNKPASLKNEMLDSEEKNTGQVGFQPNDVQAGVGK